MKWLISQEKEFLKAFDLYADALYRHCYFRVSDQELARDIVSETFTRTWGYIVKGKKIDNLRAFLYRTLNHLIIDEYRKKSTESLDLLLDEYEVPESAFEGLVHGSREETERTLDARYVHELLRRMPPQYRDVVVMRYFDELQPAEIAELLHESVNTVSVRIHRGIAWLSKQRQEHDIIENGTKLT